MKHADRNTCGSKQKLRGREPGVGGPRGRVRGLRHRQPWVQRGDHTAGQRLESPHIAEMIQSAAQQGLWRLRTSWLSPWPPSVVCPAVPRVRATATCGAWSALPQMDGRWTGQQLEPVAARDGLPWCAYNPADSGVVSPAATPSRVAVAGDGQQQAAR